jgi:hypothetical protein
VGRGGPGDGRGTNSKDEAWRVGWQAITPAQSTAVSSPQHSRQPIDNAEGSALAGARQWPGGVILSGTGVMVPVEPQNYELRTQNSERTKQTRCTLQVLRMDRG